MSLKVHETLDIVKIYMDSVKESDIDVNIESFEETVVIRLEVHKGEIILAPEKVRQCFSRPKIELLSLLTPCFFVDM